MVLVPEGGGLHMLCDTNRKIRTKDDDDDDDDDDGGAYSCSGMCYVDARDVEHSELLVHRRHVPGDDHDTDDDDDMHIVTIMLKYYCSVYNLHFLTSM